MADDNTVDAAFLKAMDAGYPTVLVNCAGQGVFGPVGTQGRLDVDDVLAGNLIGTILFCERAFRVFRPGEGVIVNVMSTAAQVGRANEAIYCASKWGARGYTESLRIEAKKTKLRVIAVYPGGMRTPFWEQARGVVQDASSFMDPEEVTAAIIECIRSRRTSYTSDIVINRTA